jgi:hypothetical protein
MESASASPERDAKLADLERKRLAAEAKQRAEDETAAATKMQTITRGRTDRGLVKAKRAQIAAEEAEAERKRLEWLAAETQAVALSQKSSGRIKAPSSERRHPFIEPLRPVKPHSPPMHLPAHSPARHLPARPPPLPQAKANGPRGGQLPLHAFSSQVMSATPSKMPPVVPPIIIPTAIKPLAFAPAPAPAVAVAALNRPPPAEASHEAFERSTGADGEEVETRSTGADGATGSTPNKPELEQYAAPTGNHLPPAAPRQRHKEVRKPRSTLVSEPLGFVTVEVSKPSRPATSTTTASPGWYEPGVELEPLRQRPAAYMLATLRATPKQGSPRIIEIYRDVEISRGMKEHLVDVEYQAVAQPQGGVSSASTSGRSTPTGRRSEPTWLI